MHAVSKGESDGFFPDHLIRGRAESEGVPAAAGVRYSLRIASFLPTACMCRVTCEEAGELNFDML